MESYTHALYTGCTLAVGVGVQLSHMCITYEWSFTHSLGEVDDGSSKSRVLAEWNDIIADYMPQDEDDNDVEGGGLVGAGDHNLTLSTNYDNRSSVGEFAVDLNGDRGDGESGSQRGSSLLDEVFSDEFFQVFENDYFHVRDSVHKPPGPADTDKNDIRRSDSDESYELREMGSGHQFDPSLHHPSSLTGVDGQLPLREIERDTDETSHKEHIPSSLNKDEKRNNGLNDHRLEEGENGVTRVKKKRKQPAVREYSFGEGHPKKKVKRKKKRKARKPPITEYTFGEAGSESQEASKCDKEAKKPVTGEYSFVTNIDDIESDEDEQVEKFTYL